MASRIHPKKTLPAVITGQINAEAKPLDSKQCWTGILPLGRLAILFRTLPLHCRYPKKRAIQHRFRECYIGLAMGEAQVLTATEMRFKRESVREGGSKTQHRCKRDGLKRALPSPRKR